MKYLFLLYGKPLPEPGTPEAAGLLATWGEATGKMRAAGVLIDCAPVQPASASTTVRVRDGETLITDGPAAEIKEQFGGFTLIECEDLDAALRWAAAIPTAADGAVEVRPVVQVPS
ncbi:MAG: YciI family protein [Gemmatimonadota bacterium]